MRSRHGTRDACSVRILPVCPRGADACIDRQPPARNLFRNPTHLVQFRKRIIYDRRNERSRRLPGSRGCRAGVAKTPRRCFRCNQALDHRKRLSHRRKDYYTTGERMKYCRWRLSNSGWIDSSGNSEGKGNRECDHRRQNSFWLRMVRLKTSRGPARSSVYRLLPASTFDRAELRRMTQAYETGNPASYQTSRCFGPRYRMFRRSISWELDGGFQTHN